ncbi:MAG: cupin domain-containing protein [Bacteroidota bacterium]
MDINKYIESGILELYVLGETNEEETRELEFLSLNYPEIKEEVQKIEESLELLAFKNSIDPHPSLKPLIIATLDYIERLEGGEALSFPPIINKNSKLSDFQEWTDRDDMIVPEEFEEIHVKIISATPQMTCAIVWINNMAPDEVHHDEHEKFLILEGTCTIVVGTKEYKLIPGDVFEIPLYEDHKVLVTSEIPCKVILQRVAA